MEILVVAKRIEHDPIKIDVYKCKNLRDAVKNYVDWFDESQPEENEIDKVTKILTREGIYEIDAGDSGVITFQLFNTDITNAMGQLS